MKLSQALVLGAQIGRSERQQFGLLIRAVNLGSHGDKDQLTRLLKELDT